MLPRLSDHAIERYQRRIADIPRDAIEEAIDTPAFRKAMEIGARAVILGSGHRAIIKDGCIVTFTPGKSKY